MFSEEELIKYAKLRMPFGKYKGTFVSELPEHYLVWFRQKGFPKGKLGEALHMTLDLKMNGAPPEFFQVLSKLRHHN